MLIINFLVASISIWLIIFINHNYLQPALKNKKRFILYKLRDKLSLLAMKGSLDEQSEEYITLVKIINGAIRASGTFQVTDYLRFLLAFHNDKELKTRISSVLEKLSDADNEEYCRIASRTFTIMHEIMQDDTRTLRYFFFPVLVSIGKIFSILRWTTPNKSIQRKKHIVEEIDEDLDCYSHEFSKMCAA